VYGNIVFLRPLIIDKVRRFLKGRGKVRADGKGLKFLKYLRRNRGMRFYVLDAQNYTLVSYYDIHFRTKILNCLEKG
jgi:hypothetical protein